MSPQQSPNAPKGTLSPAIARFLEIKSEHPECLILYRMGDFYETFFEDAVRANKLIGITLTTRGRDQNGNPVPMAGVPEKTLDQYLARLVRLGIPVAICEQSGDPSKGPLERNLARIVTPGTITENDLLPQKSDAALVAVFDAPKYRKRCGFARIVLSSGAFTVTEGPKESIVDELTRLAPSEVLCTASLRDTLQGETNAHITVLPDWHFSPEIGLADLKEQFGIDDIYPLGLEGKNEILSAVGALLGYIRNTQRTLVHHLKMPVFEHTGDFVGLDAVSRRNLEITQTLSGSPSPTLFSTIDRCRTTMGSRMLRQWLNNPIRKKETIFARQNALESLLANEALSQEIAAALDTLPDLERLSGRLALRSVRPKELVALKNACPQLARAASKIRLLDNPYMTGLAEKIVLEPELYTLLDNALIEEPAASLREGDVIKSSLNHELGELRALRDHSGNLITEMEAREKERTGIATLRIEFNRVQGYFIEITKSFADKAPEDYIRKQTLKNTERFTTPELREFEQRTLSAQEKASALQKSLYDELLSSLSPFISKLQQAADAASQADAVAALSAVARENEWVKPEISDAPGLEIYGARHPVIERTVKTYTANDCVVIPGRRLLMITGPNMGGKSTYMRSVALIVLLAYIGSYIPAQSARIGPIDHILTRIGASDDLAHNRSTFMVEMSEAAAILHSATANSLVLMDEIGRGTSTLDGLSLASAIATELALRKKALTLFATHFFELTQLSDTIPDIANIHVSAIENDGKIVFLHEIKDGAASQSYGIAVAQLAGIPPSVIRRAKTVMEDLEKQKLKDHPQQLGLFTQSDTIDEENEDTADPLLEEIADLDVDSLRPRDALDKLYELREKAQQRTR